MSSGALYLPGGHVGGFVRAIACSLSAYYLTQLGRTVAIAGTKIKELVLIPQLQAALG
jgi:hypothetical protein